ncbi:MAG: hypothetical protein WDN06_12615 [Asticcacaulis sp.]
MIGGFGLDIYKSAAAHRLDYPLIVHAHAVVYVGWLVLFTWQIIMIRKGDYVTHRRTGFAALILLPLMAILGPATAIIMHRLHYDPSDAFIAFMATQFTNVIGCIVLLCTGLLWRGDGAAHKRLMLMGTLAITEPGFSRIWADALYRIFGNGVAQFFVEDYVGTVIAMLGVGVYDLVTRRRLHPAYVLALLWVLANEVTASWLFYQPWWLALCRHIAGH